MLHAAEQQGSGADKRKANRMGALGSGACARGRGGAGRGTERPEDAGGGILRRGIPRAVLARPGPARARGPGPARVSFLRRRHECRCAVGRLAEDAHMQMRCRRRAGVSGAWPQASLFCNVRSSWVITTPENSKQYRTLVRTAFSMTAVFDFPSLQHTAWADPADQPGTGDCAAAVDGAGSAGHPVMP